MARTLTEPYAGEDLGLDLRNTVYALDPTTIDLCLSVFPWALFRSTNSAVKMHTLLGLRGDIPSFIHISDGKLHDVHALDMLVPEAGAIYVMDRGYIDFGRLCGLHQAGAFFVTGAKTNLHAHRVYSASTNRTSGVMPTKPSHWTAPAVGQDCRASAAHPFQGSRDRHEAGVPHQSDHLAGVNDLRPLQKPLEGGAFSRSNQPGVFALHNTLAHRKRGGAECRCRWPVWSPIAQSSNIDINWLCSFRRKRIRAAGALGTQSAPSNRVRSSFLEGQNGWKPGWASDSHAIGVGAV